MLMTNKVSKLKFIGILTILKMLYNKQNKGPSSLVSFIKQ